MSETILTEMQLTELKRKLPKGYDKKLQKRLKDKAGKSYHISSIRRGLMFTHQSSLIVEQAMELANEYQEGIEKLKDTLNPKDDE